MSVINIKVRKQTLGSLDIRSLTITNASSNNLSYIIVISDKCIA